MSKAKTKVDKRWLDLASALGCCVCLNEGLGATPAAMHHINSGAMGKKSKHLDSIPLCPNHHQYADGTIKFQGHIAVHKDLTEFERRYGTERELLEQTRKTLNFS